MAGGSFGGRCSRSVYILHRHLRMAVSTQLDDIGEGNLSSFTQRSAHRYIYVIIMQCKGAAQGNGNNAKCRY